MDRLTQDHTASPEMMVGMGMGMGMKTQESHCPTQNCFSYLSLRLQSVEEQVRSKERTEVEKYCSGEGEVGFG